jgi:hypothetical protein
MRGKIFINYRREDDPGHAQALRIVLEQELGKDIVFMDVIEGSIPPGDRFDQVILKEIEASEVVLVVIGPRWLTLLQRPRSSQEIDYVMLEIKAALDGKRVIPVLVGGAPLPNQLPPSIRELALKQAVTLASSRWDADCRALGAALRAIREKARLDARAQRLRVLAEANYSSSSQPKSNLTLWTVLLLGVLLALYFVVAFAFDWTRLV